MPNQRSKKQKAVLVMMEEDFRDEIDAALRLAGFSDRSAFIRAAVYRRLEELGIKIPPGLYLGPSRKNKGGSPSHRQNVNIGKVTGGKVEVIKKKQSTSIYDVPGPKGAAQDWRLNEDPNPPQKPTRKPKKKP
jgi:hypothetical protein